MSSCWLNHNHMLLLPLISMWTLYSGQQRCTDSNRLPPPTSGLQIVTQFTHGVSTKRDRSCFYSIINISDGLSFTQSRNSGSGEVGRNRGGRERGWWSFNLQACCERSCIHATSKKVTEKASDFIYKSKTCCQCRSSHVCMIYVYLTTCSLSARAQ